MWVKNEMSSPYLTGKKSEILHALPIVCELAEKTLNSSELERAEHIATLLAGTKRNRIEAIQLLRKLVSPPPKRPLYYAQYEMHALPRWTRNGIRYLGDYIDLLVKAMAYQVTENPKCKQSSLGSNLRKIKPRKYGINQSLLDKLIQYNSFLYQPGKHDFYVPKGRSHRFTSREVVLTAFVTMKLAEEIKKISTFAEQISTYKATLEEL